MGTSAAEIFLPILNCHMWMLDQPISFICPFYRLDVALLLLSILIYRVLFGWFSRVVVLQFSCNFDVDVG